VADPRWYGSLGRPGAVALLVLLSLPLVTTRLNASDEIQFFAWLRSVAFDRDVDFQNEYQYFYDAGPGRNPGFRETFLERENENGRRLNFAPVGTAILWAPFYAAGHAVAVLTDAPRNGYSAPYVRAVAYGSAIYGWLAILLSASIVWRVLHRGPASAAIVLLGTPLLFYMYVAPGFAHACSAFAVSLFLWTWIDVRDLWTLGGCVRLALCGGLMAMVREQDALVLAGPALDFAASFIWPPTAPATAFGPADPPDPAWRRRAALAGLAGAGAFLLAYAPQLAAYTALNGHPGPTTYVTRKMSWSAPYVVDVLVSPAHGFLEWTPLAAVALAGLVWLVFGGTRGGVRDARWIGAVALLTVALQAYVSGSVESWTVAGSFGQRRFVALTPVLALGLAALTPPRSAASDGWGALRAAVVAACIWWNLGLMAQFGLHLMDRQRLHPAENARVTFLDLPRQAPALAWRYLTDRRSFFGLPPRQLTPSRGQ
jgi:hypothetical protein